VAGIPPLKGFPIFPQPLRLLFGIRGETFDRVARDEISQYDKALYVSLDFDPKPEKFSSDGFHPSEESYRDFAEMMAGRIVERLQTNDEKNA
jgi:lysophospholipase L1-like esterase